MEKIEEMMMEMEMSIERNDLISARYYQSQVRNELTRLCKLKDKKSKMLVNENVQKLYNLERYL